MYSYIESWLLVVQLSCFISVGHWRMILSQEYGQYLEFSQYPVRSNDGELFNYLPGSIQLSEFITGADIHRVCFLFKTGPGGQVVDIDGV